LGVRLHGSPTCCHPPARGRRAGVCLHVALRSAKLGEMRPRLDGNNRVCRCRRRRTAKAGSWTHRPGALEPPSPSSRPVPLLLSAALWLTVILRAPCLGPWLSRLRVCLPRVSGRRRRINKCCAAAVYRDNARFDCLMRGTNEWREWTPASMLPKSPGCEP